MTKARSLNQRDAQGRARPGVGQVQTLGRVPFVNNYSTIIHQQAYQNNGGSLNANKFGTVTYDNRSPGGRGNDFATLNKNSDAVPIRLSDKPPRPFMHNYMTSSNARGRNPTFDNELNTFGVGQQVTFDRTAKSTRNVQQVEIEWLDRL